MEKIIASSILAVLVSWALVRVLNSMRNKPPKAPRPPAPCGNDDEHYWWVSDHWPCPICAGNHDRIARKNAKEDQADLIASKVVDKLRRNGGL